MHRRSYSLLLCLVAALQFCPAADVTLSLRHTVSGKPLLLNSLHYRTTHDETYSISRLSYLISELALQDQQGSWHTIPESVAWIRAGARRNEIHLSGLADCGYQALRFDIGLRESVNHSDLPVIRPLTPQPKRQPTALDMADRLYLSGPGRPLSGYPRPVAGLRLPPRKHAQSYHHHPALRRADPTAQSH